jgi:CxxC-x17-CxxC domain-containing protein
MQFTDRVLKCSLCSTEFVFTAGEQLFFSDKNFKHDPARCRTCRAKRCRVQRGFVQETETTCAMCGSVTTVPFKPTQGRPVLCRSCFETGPPPVPSVGVPV